VNDRSAAFLFILLLAGAGAALYLPSLKRPAPSDPTPAPGPAVKAEVLYFGAKWCAPCRTFGPTFDGWASKHGAKATFRKVDIDAEPALAKRHGITSIPAVVVTAAGANRRVEPLTEERLLREIRAFGDTSCRCGSPCVGGCPCECPDPCPCRSTARTCRPSCTCVIAAEE
jgi:thiol-disulfide isomerase/thioredoxin